MATQVNPAQSQSRFHRFPLEIVLLIIKNAVDEAVEDRKQYYYKDSYRLLKALRLTHERFANLGYINKILFTSIQLEPTRACLTSIQRGDFSRVAKYVRTIVFITPPSWALLFETFKQLVTISALQILAEPFAGQYRPNFPTYNFESSLQDKFVNEHLGGKWPFTEAQLADGYAAYMRDAKATQELLEKTDELKTAWVEILRQLGRCLDGIEFPTRHCEELCLAEYFDTPKTEVPCQLGSHQHFNNDDEYGCKYATGIAGDRLFTTVMSCVAATGIAVRQISINQIMAGNLECANIIGWKDLDLTALDKLEFKPDIPSDEHRQVSERVFNALPCQKEDEIEKQVSRIFEAFIQKCHTSLRHLEISGQGPMVWPCHSALDMPALEYLRHAFGSINPLLFRDWMARMPRLRHLELQLGLCKGFKYTDWTAVYDAIRDHPNVVGPDPKGLYVRFDQIITSDWSETSWHGVLCRDVNIATERRARHPEYDEIEDLPVALEKHLYGEVPFRENYVLRHWLDDDESESESESEDDEDYDEEEEDGEEDEDEDEAEDIGSDQH
ncbi:hypothetical protein ACHAPJ_004225 [Fusarium lateritium]